jgi:hypothetical protein
MIYVISSGRALRGAELALVNAIEIKRRLAYDINTFGRAVP